MDTYRWPFIRIIIFITSAYRSLLLDTGLHKFAPRMARTHMLLFIWPGEIRAALFLSYKHCLGDNYNQHKTIYTILCTVLVQYLGDFFSFILDMWPTDTDRVTGGWPAHDGQFPYQVSIRMISNVGNMITCGGSIVDNEWIITSAHCLAK